MGLVSMMGLGDKCPKCQRNALTCTDVKAGDPVYTCSCGYSETRNAWNGKRK